MDQHNSITLYNNNSIPNHSPPPLLAPMTPHLSNYDNSASSSAYLATPPAYSRFSVIPDCPLSPPILFRIDEPIREDPPPSLNPEVVEVEFVQQHPPLVEEDSGIVPQQCEVSWFFF